MAAVYCKDATELGVNLAPDVVLTLANTTEELASQA